MDYVPVQYWTERFSRHGHTGDADPTIYAYDQPQRVRALERALRGIGGFGPGPARALDVGCGTGDVIALLSSLGVRTITALDLSVPVIDHVRHRFAGSPIELTLHAEAIEDATLPAARAERSTDVGLLQQQADARREGGGVRSHDEPVLAVGHPVVVFPGIGDHHRELAGHRLGRARREPCVRA